MSSTIQQQQQSWMNDSTTTTLSTMQGSFLVINNNKTWEHNNNPCQEKDPIDQVTTTTTTPPLLMSSNISSNSSSSSHSSFGSDNDTMINTTSSMRDSFLHVDLAATLSTTDSGRAQHPYAQRAHETQTGARRPRWSCTMTALTRSMCGNHRTNNSEPYDSTLQASFQDDLDDDDDDDETVVDNDQEDQEQEQFQKQVPDKPLRRPSLLSALLGSHTVVNGNDSPVHLTCEENKEQQQHSLSSYYTNDNSNDTLSSSLQYCVDWEQLQNAGPLFITTLIPHSHSTLHYRFEPFQSGWW